jgi:hypothetical protein
MSRGRVVITGRPLAVVIRGWLRSTPERLWGKDHSYEKLKKLGRHDPEFAPDPRLEVAEYIASRLDELGWEVSYPEPKNHG